MRKKTIVSVLIFIFSGFYILNTNEVSAEENNVYNEFGDQSRELTILDDSFKNKNDSLFKVLNNPWFVTWLGEPGGAIIRYDRTLSEGLVTKRPYYVFGGMNYSIVADTFYSVMVRIKDANTGEVYLSSMLPEDRNTELKFKIPRDTQVNIYLHAPIDGDSNILGFTLKLNDF